jgi:hypothetical protein
MDKMLKDYLQFLQAKLGLTEPINILFDQGCPSFSRGYVHQDHPNTIFVSPNTNSTWLRVLETIAHEAVHLKQIKFDGLKSNANWTINYKDKVWASHFGDEYNKYVPWEQEALTLGNYLFNEWEEKSNENS